MEANMLRITFMPSANSIIILRLTVKSKVSETCTGTSMNLRGFTNLELI